MNYEDMVLAGMRLIKEGCKKIYVCENCPFHLYCLEISGVYKSPNEWEIDDDEDN